MAKEELNHSASARARTCSILLRHPDGFEDEAEAQVSSCECCSPAPGKRARGKHLAEESPNHRMTLIGRQIAPPAERYFVLSVALVAVRACFRVRRRSTRTSTDGPPGSSVNPSRQRRVYVAPNCTSRTGQQFPHPHQVIRRRCEGEHPTHLLDSPMPHLPHQGD